MTANRIAFFVTGDPVPWHRGKPMVQVHPDLSYKTWTPKNAKDRKWQAHIASIARKAMDAQGWAFKPDGFPLIMECEFFFEPKTEAKRLKEKARWVRHTKQPDADNLLKNVKDALSGVLYNDDRQIVSPTPTKTYSERPGVLVEIFKAYPQRIPPFKENWNVTEIAIARTGAYEWKDPFYER